MGKLKDLTGKRFGRLFVVERAKIPGPVTWNVICDCGKEKNVRGSAMKSGLTKSCGCLFKEKRKEASIIHGHSGGKPSKTYKVWVNMKSRCLNKNATYYEYYGGRGITVCDEWIDSFEKFLEDMGEAPIGKQIDRIDNNKGYSRKNCRWSTSSENCLNRRPRNSQPKLENLR